MRTFCADSWHSKCSSEVVAIHQAAKNCLNNIGRVLKDPGMNYSDVVSVQIFLVDMSQFPEVNSNYQGYFKAPLPARTIVQVSKLSLGVHVEVAAVAQK